MSYFNQFPTTTYDVNKDGVLDEVVDIFRYVDVRDADIGDISSYTWYEIADGERPDIVSQKLYGTPKYYWTFFVVNDSLKHGMEDWPLSHRETEKFLEFNFDKFSVLKLQPVVSENSLTGTVSENSGYQTYVNNSFNFFNTLNGLLLTPDVFIKSTDKEEIAKIQNFDATTQQVVIEKGTVASITIDSAGSGYILPPTLVFSDSPTGVKAEALVNINHETGAVEIAKIVKVGSGYSQVPSISVFEGPSREPNVQIFVDGDAISTTVNIVDTGEGFAKTPLVSFSEPSDGEAATGYCILDSVGGISSIVVTSGGSGYSSQYPPSISFEIPSDGRAEFSAVLVDDEWISNVNTFSLVVPEVENKEKVETFVPLKYNVSYKNGGEFLSGSPVSLTDETGSWIASNSYGYGVFLKPKLPEAYKVCIDTNNKVNYYDGSNPLRSTLDGYFTTWDVSVKVNGSQLFTMDRLTRGEVWENEGDFARIFTKKKSISSEIQYLWRTKFKNVSSVVSPVNEIHVVGFHAPGVWKETTESGLVLPKDYTWNYSNEQFAPDGSIAGSPTYSSGSKNHFLINDGSSFSLPNNIRYLKDKIVNLFTQYLIYDDLSDYGNDFEEVDGEDKLSGIVNDLFEDSQLSSDLSLVFKTIDGVTTDPILYSLTYNTETGEEKLVIHIDRSTNYDITSPYTAKKYFSQKIDIEISIKPRDLVKPGYQTTGLFNFSSGITSSEITGYTKSSNSITGLSTELTDLDSQGLIVLDGLSYYQTKAYNNTTDGDQFGSDLYAPLTFLSYNIPTEDTSNCFSVDITGRPQTIYEVLFTLNEYAYSGGTVGNKISSSTPQQYILSIDTGELGSGSSSICGISSPQEGRIFLVEFERVVSERFYGSTAYSPFYGTYVEWLRLNNPSLYQMLISLSKRPDGSINTTLFGTIMGELFTFEISYSNPLGRKGLCHYESDDGKLVSSGIEPYVVPVSDSQYESNSDLPSPFAEIPSASNFVTIAECVTRDNDAKRKIRVIKPEAIREFVSSFRQLIQE